MLNASKLVQIELGQKKKKKKKIAYVCGYPTVPAKKYQPETFFRENLQKIIEDLYLFTEKSETCIFCAI